MNKRLLSFRNPASAGLSFVFAALLAVISANNSYAQLPPFSCSMGNSYVPISGSPGPTGDDVTITVTMPFGFTYIGNNYTQVSICTNGWVAMGVTTSATYVNNLCTTTPGDRNKLCPFWEDLYVMGGGNIQYTTLGSAPNRIFVVQYTNVPYFSGSGNVTFQVKLYEGINTIEFLYGPAVANPSATGSIGLIDGVGGPGHFISVTPGPDCGSTTISTTGCFNLVPYIFPNLGTGVKYTFGTPPVPPRNRTLTLPTPGVNSNYVLFPFQSSMVGFQNVTIEAWVKIGSSGTTNTVLNKGAGSYDYQLGINAGTTNPYFRAQGVIVTANTITITPGIWTHLAVTYDGSTVRFYKDGALGFSQLQSAPLGTSANEMRIGRGNTEPGSGNLEEIRLWTVARTQQQVDSNKCRKFRTSFSSSGGLLALWHFDSTYVDSISGYNGTPFGSVGFDTVSYPPPGANCTLVGITHNQNEIPSKYSLEQNYPNPFNPTTIINFQLPIFNYVNLVIYDVLGREVATLVNEEVKPGTYEIQWDASNEPSGVYFYKITAGEYVETRRMILLK